jgi:hypothetical protein
VGAVNLGQDGDGESRVQNVIVRGAAIPWIRACLHALRGLGVSMAMERVRGQMHARQLAHDRACRVRTRSGCAGVSCVSWLAVDRHGHLLGSC